MTNSFIVKSPAVEVIPYTELDLLKVAEFNHGLAQAKAHHLRREGLSNFVTKNHTLKRSLEEAYNARDKMRERQAASFLICLADNIHGVAYMTPGVSLDSCQVALTPLLRRRTEQVRMIYSDDPANKKIDIVTDCLGTDAYDAATDTALKQLMDHDQACNPQTSLSLYWSLLPDSSPRQQAFRRAGFTEHESGSEYHVSSDNPHKPLKSSIYYKMDV